MKLFNGWLRPSGCASSACVEVSKGEDGMIQLRSSLSPYGVARMTEEEFKRFIQSAKAGGYDHLYEEDELVPEIGFITKEDLQTAYYIADGGFKNKNVDLPLDEEEVVSPMHNPDWDKYLEIARAQVIDYEQRREQQIMKEGYTGDL